MAESGLSGLPESGHSPRIEKSMNDALGSHLRLLLLQTLAANCKGDMATWTRLRANVEQCMKAKSAVKHALATSGPAKRQVPNIECSASNDMSDAR